MLKKLLCLIPTLLLFVGCNDEYTGHVKSMTASPIKNKSFFVTPYYKGVNKGDIEFQVFSNILKSVLKPAGLKEVKYKADIAVMLGYSIKGRTEINSYTTLETTTVNTTTTDYSGNTYNSTGTITTPKTTVYSQRINDRFVIISFVDMNHYRKTKKVKELSRLTISSTGTSSNLSEILPVIMRMAIPFVGTNKMGNVHVEIDKGKRVVDVSSKVLSEVEEAMIKTIMNQELFNIDLTE